MQELEVTYKGQNHLESLMQTNDFMNDVSSNRLHHNVILFHLNRGEDLQDIYFTLVDAAPGDPEQASRKFAYETDILNSKGFIVRSTGLGYEYEDI